MAQALISVPTQDFVQKTLGAALLQGVTAAATLNNLTGIQNLPGVFIVDRVDSNGVETPNLVEVIKYTATSGLTTTTLTRGLAGTSDQDHAISAVVEFVPDIIWAQAIYDALTQVVVAATGLLDTTKVVDLTTAQTLTTKTLTSPKIGTQIGDTGGNELLKLTATASAVNELTLANAAAGNSPAIQMSGGDTDVGFDFRMKGAGRLRKPTIIEIPVGAAGADLSTGDAKAFFIIPEELNGMNLTGVSGKVYAAGTTNTLDVQVRNQTQTADMLSTKLTIDSGELSSATAAAPPVIDAGNDDVATDDTIAIDIDAVHTTPAQGLIVKLRFELP